MNHKAQCLTCGGRGFDPSNLPCPTCGGEGWAWAQAVAVHSPTPPGLTPADAELQPFGWAPGGYELKCQNCGDRHDFADKRSTYCRPCAVEVREKYLTANATLPPPVLTTGAETRPFLEMEIVLGEGGISVSGGKRKSALFMDTVSFSALDAPVEIGASLPLNEPMRSDTFRLRFTKPEAVDVVIEMLNLIKASFPGEAPKAPPEPPKGLREWARMVRDSKVSENANGNGWELNGERAYMVDASTLDTLLEIIDAGREGEPGAESPTGTGEVRTLVCRPGCGWQGEPEETTDDGDGGIACPKCKRTSLLELPDGEPGPEATPVSLVSPAPGPVREWWMIFIRESGKLSSIDTKFPDWTKEHHNDFEVVHVVAQPPAPQPIPPPLTWTKEKPKVEGWYCWRSPNSKSWAVADIRIVTGAPCWHSNERMAWVGIYHETEWAGPIPEPQAQPIPPEAGT